MPERNGSHQVPARRWGVWLLIFCPLLIAGFIVTEWVGLAAAVAALAVLLIAVLAYQRLVRGQSWRTLLWGERRATR